MDSMRAIAVYRKTWKNKRLFACSEHARQHRWSEGVWKSCNTFEHWGQWMRQIPSILNSFR